MNEIQSIINIIRALDTDLGVFLEDCSVIEVTVDLGLDNGA